LPHIVLFEQDCIPVALLVVVRRPRPPNRYGSTGNPAAGSKPPQRNIVKGNRIIGNSPFLNVAVLIFTAGIKMIATGDEYDTILNPRVLSEGRRCGKS
jgi:hypothetical protein